MMGQVETQQTIFAKGLIGGEGAKRDDTMRHGPLPEWKVEANKTLVQRRQQLIEFTGGSKIKTKTVTEWGTDVQGLVEMPQEDFKRSLQELVDVQQKQKKAEEARAKPVEKGNSGSAWFCKVLQGLCKGASALFWVWAMSSETLRMWKLDGRMILQ